MQFDGYYEVNIQSAIYLFVRDDKTVVGSGDGGYLLGQALSRLNKF